MALPVLFVVMTLLAILFLLISSILSSIAITQLQPPDSYRNAHTYLIVSTVMNWTAFALISVTLGLAMFAGGLTSPEISNDFLERETISDEEIEEICGAKEELKSNELVKKIVAYFIVGSILLVLLSFIFNMIALTNLAKTKRGSPAEKAYLKTILNLVSGLLQLTFLMIAIWGYSTILGFHRRQMRIASKHVPD